MHEPPRRLSLTFRRAADGRTVLAHRHGGWPWMVTRPLYLHPQRPGRATVILQCAGAGLMGGDHTEIAVTAGPGADAVVTTQGALCVFAMPGAGARHGLALTAEAGASLLWDGDPLVLFPAARLESRVRLAVAAGARLTLIEATTWHRPQGHRPRQPCASGDLPSGHSQPAELADGALATRLDLLPPTGPWRSLIREHLDPRALSGGPATGPGAGLACLIDLTPGATPPPAEAPAGLPGPPRLWGGIDALPQGMGQVGRWIACDGPALTRLRQALRRLGEPGGTAER